MLNPSIFESMEIQARKARKGKTAGSWQPFGRLRAYSRQWAAFSELQNLRATEPQSHGTSEPQRTDDR
jgi:hypothetical protein